MQTARQASRHQQLHYTAAQNHCDDIAKDDVVMKPPSYDVVVNPSYDRVADVGVVMKPFFADVDINRSHAVVGDDIAGGAAHRTGEA